MSCNKGSLCAVRASICACKCVNVFCAFGDTLANPACLTNVARHHFANRSPRFGLSFMLSMHMLKSFIAKGPLKRPTVVSIARLSCTDKHLSNNCTSSAANACAKSVARESAFGGTNVGAAVVVSSFFPSPAPKVFSADVVAPFTDTSSARTLSPSVSASSSSSSSSSSISSSIVVLSWCPSPLLFLFADADAALVVLELRSLPRAAAADDDDDDVGGCATFASSSSKPILVASMTCAGVVEERPPPRDRPPLVVAKAIFFVEVVSKGRQSYGVRSACFSIY